MYAFTVPKTSTSISKPGRTSTLFSCSCVSTQTGLDMPLGWLDAPANVRYRACEIAPRSDKSTDTLYILHCRPPAPFENRWQRAWRLQQHDPEGSSNQIAKESPGAFEVLGRTFGFSLGAKIARTAARG